jgi:hypothetical protein
MFKMGFECSVIFSAHPLPTVSGIATLLGSSLFASTRYRNATALQCVQLTALFHNVLVEIRRCIAVMAAELEAANVERSWKKTTSCGNNTC